MPQARSSSPSARPTAWWLASVPLLAGLPGCVLAELAPAGAYISANPGISLSTDPPGARILVDGKDSGFVTPCFLGLEPRDDHLIEFVRPGYLPAMRFLTPDSEVYALLWREMSLRPGTWRFPLWLNLQDFLSPVKYRATLSPGRVHVKLVRSADTKSAENARQAPVEAAPAPAAAGAR